MDKKSKLGYSRKSPYRGNPYLDITTPEGLIDMSDTDLALLARDNTGMTKVLPPFSGMHQFRGDVVREMPIRQQGGLAYDIIFDEDEEEVEESPVEQEVVEEAPVINKTEEDDSFALSLATQDFSSVHKSRNPYYAAVEEASEGAYSSTGVRANSSNKAKEAFEYYKSKGLAPHVAAGIVGNFMQESGLNPTIKGDNGAALGIGQWHPDRQKQLFNFAQGRNPFDLHTQLDFALYEAQQRGDLDKVRLAKTADEAAYLWAKHYERPKVIDKRRGAYANNLLTR